MDTTGRAERLVLQELLYVPGRIEKRKSWSTDQLIDAYVESRDGDITQQSAETAVRRALGKLVEIGFVIKVSDAGEENEVFLDYGKDPEYAEWQITRTGAEEAKALREEFKHELRALRRKYGSKKDRDGMVF